MSTRMKRTWTVTAAVIVTGVLVYVVALNTRVSGSAPGVTGNVTHLQAHPAEHRVPTIDGASRPDLISDSRALSLLLVTAADPDDRVGRSYLRHILNKGRPSGRRSGADAVEAIRLAAIDYTKAIQGVYGSRSHTARDEVETLLTQYRVRVTALLGHEGDTYLSDVLNARIKPHIRVFSTP